MYKILKGIHTLAFGHKSIPAHVQQVNQEAVSHHRFISAAEASDEGRLYGESRVIQPGVDPIEFCRDARFFRAVAQAPFRNQTPTVSAIDEQRQEENKKAAKIIVLAAQGDAYADVTHSGIGPDEVDALQSIAHTWLLQMLPIDEMISRVQTLLDLLHENQEELNIEELPNVLADDN